MEQVKKEVRFTSASGTPAGAVSIKLDTMRTETVSLHHVGGGEWRASSETALHKCAFCRVAVAGGQHPAHLIDALLADHRAVCERRPVEIGDYVRWDGQMDDGSNSERWAEGEVVRFVETSEGRKIQVRLTSRSDKGFSERPFFTGPVLRRIPRPGAGERTRGAQHAPAPPQFIAPPPLHPETIAALERLKERAYACLGVPQGSPPRCACGDDHPPGKPAQTDPLDVKYDRFTLRDLLVKDATLREDRPTMLRLPLTPAQRAAVSAHWSAQLRAKVAASREAERNRVRVDLECEPWE